MSDVKLDDIAKSKTETSDINLEYIRDFVIDELNKYFPKINIQKSIENPDWNAYISFETEKIPDKKTLILYIYLKASQQQYILESQFFHPPQDSTFLSVETVGNNIRFWNRKKNKDRNNVEIIISESLNKLDEKLKQKVSFEESKEVIDRQDILDSEIKVPQISRNITLKQSLDSAIIILDIIEKLNKDKSSKLSISQIWQLKENLKRLLKQCNALERFKYDKDLNILSKYDSSIQKIDNYLHFVILSLEIEAIEAEFKQMYNDFIQSNGVRNMEIAKIEKCIIFFTQILNKIESNKENESNKQFKGNFEDLHGKIKKALNILKLEYDTRDKN